MTQIYIDIAKVWSANVVAIALSQGIEMFTQWNEAIQAGLTTLLLIASLAYTITKFTNERRKKDVQDDR